MLSFHAKYSLFKMIHILCTHVVLMSTSYESPARRTKNNPVLIGEPGVGKTAIGKLLCATFHIRLLFCI